MSMIVNIECENEYDKKQKERRSMIKIYLLSGVLYKYKIWFMQNVKIKIDVKHNRTICLECRMWFNKFDICNMYFVS